MPTAAFFHGKIHILQHTVSSVGRPHVVSKLGGEAKDGS